MKKMIFALVCIFALATKVSADNYKPIAQDQLPQKAQSFLLFYFPKAEISLARKETEFMELNYGIIFTDGSKVEFDHKGNWAEVDCIPNPLPEGIVPAAINKVVKDRYPTARVMKIERDNRGYEVVLNNRVELTFNKDMQLIDID